MAVTPLRATVDAWVDQTRPSANYGQAAYLWLNGDGAATKKAYIFFGKPFPPNAYIASATLNLYVYTAWSGAKTITVKRVTTKWSENELTYNNVPTVTATNSAAQAVTSPVTGQQVQFDLTTMLSDVSAGGDWFGVEVTVSGSATVKLYAAENPDQTKRAELDVDWSKIPEDPVNLVPANGQAVNLARPILAWQFDTKDHSAIRRQASSQVQISTSTDFSSPEYDSGQRSNTINNWDLSQVNYSVSMGTVTVTIASPAVFTFNAHGLILGDQVKFTTTGALPTGLTAGTTYYVSAIPGGNTFRVSATLGGADVNTSGTQSGTHTLSRFGVTDTQTRYWRVRVWDDKGQVSAYSDTVSFQRQAKGTLTMNSPGAGAPATLSETTPPITWNLAGETQEAFELRLYRYVGTQKKLLWRLPKLTSTATSYELPAGYVHETDTFSAELLVWDAVDRAITPGDPDYYLVEHTFIYNRAGGPTAVTGLTTTADNGGVQLDFSRATAPAYFAVKEDGKLVEDRLDPTTLSQGGTSYRFTHFRSTPNTSHTYEVEAVEDVAGILKHSSGNSTATHSPSPVGIILVDPTDKTRVTVVGPDSLVPDFSIGEEGTTYAPIGSRRKVRILDSVAGYEGTVSGQLEGLVDRDNFFTLKGRSPIPLRLIFGGVNIEVILEEVSIVRRGDMPSSPLYDVSFSFFQNNAADTFTVTGLG